MITLGLTQQSGVIMIHLVQIASVIQHSVNQIRCVEASYILEPQYVSNNRYPIARYLCKIFVFMRAIKSDRPMHKYMYVRYCMSSVALPSDMLILKTNS